jgi:transcription elongation factor Elf1
MGMKIELRTNHNTAQIMADRIEPALMERAHEVSKERLAEQISEMRCKQCNVEKSYEIINFEKDGYTTIAHARCTNCGFSGELKMTAIPDSSVEDAKQEVIESIHSLQSALENIGKNQ